MVWWVWLVAVVVVLGLLVGAVAGVQARRRSGGVIVVRRGRRPGRGKVR